MILRLSLALENAISTALRRHLIQSAPFLPGFCVFSSASVLRRIYASDGLSSNSKPKKMNRIE